MKEQSKPYESERRQVTVMFADISGFTAMSEKMDPEEVTSIMNYCFSMMGSIIENHGGTIDKFIGDCIMVLFGVPVALEEAPQKALNTAIEMRNRLYQFNMEKNLKIPLDIHIGINTGMVIAGLVGSDEKKEYTVMGDTVNLASRLENASGKGQIYVGPLTHKHTKNEFEYKQLEPISLKGKEKPIPIFELLSVKKKIHRARLGAERMIYSEMVGRNKELDKLELHVLKAINGNGSIVSVIGEAGIGKSRLIAELRRKDAIKRVTFLEGRALSTGKNLSFHPIIDILKSWAKIEERDTDVESIHKLEKAIRSVDSEEVGEILPFTATLMGIKLTGKYAERVKGIEGETLEKLILKNIRELIVKAAEISPIVFVIEDLHWADLTSIELLESLYRLAENNRILFINVFRPGHKETGDRVLDTIKERYGNYHLEIYLEPLDENQCEVLINNLLKIKGLPAHIRELITKRAEGNPFFIEEVGRSFIDDRVVEIKDGIFRVTDKIDSVVIPETIHDVLMSRIDKLDEQTKSLLKVASVIGRNFLYRILAEVAKTIEEIDEKLDYLKGVQLILEKKRREELAYLFKHALAQEATYESILLRKRKELHLQIASSIESIFSERLHEFYGMLALHYSRGENHEKAEEYLIKAGEEALKVSASIEALYYYQEALKLYLKKHGDSGDPQKIASLEKNIALALYNKAHYVEAIEHFDKVLEYWGEKRPKNKIIVLLNFIANLLSIIKNLYFPLRRSKRIPDKIDNEIINLGEKRGLALAQVDTKRMFFDTIGVLKRVSKLDITKVENGTALYIEGSGIFSFSGVSFKLSRKILDYTKEYINKSDMKSIFFYNLFELMHDFISGNWNEEREYDENLVNRYLKTGDVYQAVIYIIFSALLRIEQGYFSDVKFLLDKMHEIGEIYDNDHARSAKYFVNTKLLLKRRRLYDALNEADAG
ncbi:MAG: adenylate/guanylate cyclase domain-containing protein, partial [Fidelibacterota bacterium]